MKKYLIVLFAALSFSLTGCEETDIEPGGTAVEKMAGLWDVTWEQQNAQGVWEDVLGGTVSLNTYNTAANVPTEMWLKEGYLLNTPLKVSTDYAARTFQMAETTLSVNEKNWGVPQIKLTITDGKILEGAATTPSGMPADSILFFVNVEGDGTYKVAGFRHTGFAEDE